MEVKMQYTIHTLEIEIANLRQTLRNNNNAIKSYEDARGGSYPDINKIKRNIKELEKAIEVLKQVEFQEPELMELIGMEE